MNVALVALAISGILLGSYGSIVVLARYSRSVQNAFIFLKWLKGPASFERLQDPENHLPSPSGTWENVYIPSEGDKKLGAWVHTPSDGTEGEKESQEEQQKKLWILYVHGNAGTRGSWPRRRFYKHLIATIPHAHVLSLDCRGFGDSEGSPTEEGVVSDVISAVDWIAKRNEGSSVDLVLYGLSLGTGIVIQAGKHLETEGNRHENISLAGIVLEAPYSSIVEAAATHWISLPFRPFIKWIGQGFVDRFESVHHILSLDRIPLLVIHGNKDYTIPDAQGKKLHQTAVQSRLQNASSSSSLTLFESVEGGGHNNLLNFQQSRDALLSFLKQIHNPSQ